MNRKISLIVPVLFGLVLFSMMIFGTSQRPDQNSTIPQGRNLIGGNMQGMTPDLTPNAGTIPGGNRDTGPGNSPSDVLGMGATPGVDNRTGLNRTGQQLQQQPTGFDRQRSDAIRRHLSGVYGLGDINTIVNGNTALVGYNSAISPVDKAAVGNMIASRIRRIDSTVVNVVVSDSTDVSSRIVRLWDNIKNNADANDLNNEFNQLVQTVKPVGF